MSKGPRMDFDGEEIKQLRRLYRVLLDKAESETGIPKEAIAGRSRTRRVAKIRSEIWLELWSWGWSTPEIGHVVGRDHSSIVRSNVIMRRADSTAGYALKARAAENRRIVNMAAGAKRTAECVRKSLDAAEKARERLTSARDAAVEARKAYATLQNAMIEAARASAQVAATEAEAKAERSRRIESLKFRLGDLSAKDQYVAVVDAMCVLDEPEARELWADYCRPRFPLTAATPPRTWEQRIRRAA